MTSTATWLRSAEIVSREEAVAFFASRVVTKPARIEPPHAQRPRTASLTGGLIKR